MNALVVCGRGISIVCLLCSTVILTVLLVLLVLFTLQAVQCEMQAAPCTAQVLRNGAYSIAAGGTCESLLPSVRPIGPSRSPKPPNLLGLRVSDSLDALVGTN